MSKIGINYSGSNNYLNNDKKLSSDSNKIVIKDLASTFTKDQVLKSNKSVVSENPFGQSTTTVKNASNLSNNSNIRDEYKNALVNNDSYKLFEIAKLNFEKNLMPDIKPSDILRQAYNTALSEMDSDTLYAIGNFDASSNLLPDVSSEHIFKMADMTRKTY